MTPPGEQPWTLGRPLVLLALIGAHAALVTEVVKAGGRLSLASGALVVGTNAVLAALFGTIGRFRAIPLMGLFATVALTEALLWPSASEGRNTGWIAVVALVGCLLLAAAGVALRCFGPRRR